MVKKRNALGMMCLAIVCSVASIPAAWAAMELKWAHVYETNEPFHENAVWAAQEISNRTGGEITISVFPASQLGNENQINEGLTLGTV